MTVAEYDAAVCAVAARFDAWDAAARVEHLAPAVRHALAREGEAIFAELRALAVWRPREGAAPAQQPRASILAAVGGMRGWIERRLADAFGAESKAPNVTH